MTSLNDIRHNNQFKDVKEFPENIKSEPRELPEKKYVERNSLLTDLYENKHIRTNYHIVVIIVLSIFLNNVVDDFLYNEQGQSIFDFVLLGFKDFYYALLIWISMLVSSFIPYYGLVLWATVTVNLPPKSLRRLLWNITALLFAILYHLLFLTSVPILINYSKIPIAAAMTLICDTVRFSLKTYAFVRSNCPRILKYQPPVVENEILYPTIRQYLYFSFIPTVVYRDNYPRSKTISWSNVFLYVAEFIGGVFLISLIIKLFFVNSYYNLGIRKFELREIIMICFKNYLAGLIIMFNLFYVLLHAWMNLSAELLRFSDRMFYKDWWTADNYERYHRTWNIVVHDWLYTYIYKDVHDNVLPNHKLIPKVLVFFVSAALHEYVLTLSMGFFLPVLFILSFVLNVPATLYKFKSKTLGNLFVLGTIGIGSTTILCAYGMEYYCRTNLPPQNITWAYPFIPQLLKCIKL